MDFILEILFEIILEGCIDITKKKKAPLILRILCALLLVVLYGGLIGIFLFMAISCQSGVMFFITGIVTLIVFFAFVRQYKKIKKNKNLHKSYNIQNKKYT